jgi:hypothetical protein
MEYEQRVFIKLLTNESVDAHKIYTRLSAQFGEQTDALRTIQFPVREIQRGREDLHDEHRSGRLALDCIDTQTISILEKVPFESACSTAQVLNVDHATVLHRLHEKVRFKSYCLRWVLHLLTGELRAKCKELTGLIIPSREAARKDVWGHLVTGDEPWFFLLSDPHRMWALANDGVATKTKIDIQSEKFMYPIMWNSHGFHVIDRLPTGAEIKSKYYTVKIRQPLH